MRCIPQKTGQAAEEGGRGQPQTPLQQQVQAITSGGDPKRRKGENDTPPSAHRDDKTTRRAGYGSPGGWGSKGSAQGEERRTPKGGGRKATEGTVQSGAPQKGAFGGVGLTAAQRTNPLTVVATAEEYPETLQSQGDFNSFRASFRKLAKETHPEQIPTFGEIVREGGRLRLRGLRPKVKGVATK